MLDMLKRILDLILKKLDEIDADMYVAILLFLVLIALWKIDQNDWIKESAIYILGVITGALRAGLGVIQNGNGQGQGQGYNTASTANNASNDTNNNLATNERNISLPNISVVAIEPESTSLDDSKQ